MSRGVSQGFLSRLFRIAMVVVLAGGSGTLVRPDPASASDPTCGWECEGLKCKEDPNWPDITCKEEVPGTCTNFECDPSPN